METWCQKRLCCVSFNSGLLVCYIIRIYISAVIPGFIYSIYADNEGHENPQEMENKNQALYELFQHASILLKE